MPASLLVAGYARHDSYQVGTALLAGEAYADSAVVDLAIKAITRRKRPSDVAPGAPFNDTFFSWREITLQRKQFSIRARRRRFCRSHGRCHSLPHAPLGTLGGIRIRDRGQLFPGNQ